MYRLIRPNFERNRDGEALARLSADFSAQNTYYCKQRR